MKVTPCARHSLNNAVTVPTDDRVGRTSPQSCPSTDDERTSSGARSRSCSIFPPRRQRNGTQRRDAFTDPPDRPLALLSAADPIPASTEASNEPTLSLSIAPTAVRSRAIDSIGASWRALIVEPSSFADGSFGAHRSIARGLGEPESI